MRIHFMSTVFLMLLGLMLTVFPAQAEDQQTALSTCQADAKNQGLSGGKRDSYIRQCLGTRAVADSPLPTKMSRCSLHAAEKSLTGNDREMFMKSCMQSSEQPEEESRQIKQPGCC